MRVFISEFLCSGAWPDPTLPESLAREGRAMLLALLKDLAQIPDVQLCTTWDARLGDFPLDIQGVNEPPALAPQLAHRIASNIDCTIVQSPADEPAVFRRLAAQSDATYVIAPELDDLLTRRCNSAKLHCRTSLNASQRALKLCSDKWKTFQCLTAAGVPTVPTMRIDRRTVPMLRDDVVVVKPRFGAGSTDTFLVRNVDQFESAVSKFPAGTPQTEAIVQPFVDGRQLSVVAIVRADGTPREVWPVGEQSFWSGDDPPGQFQYAGGAVPARFDIERDRIDSTVHLAASAIKGLRGYIGFDLILPYESGADPLVVDINPRLTTSYLGYRALSKINLAGRILWPDGDWPSVDWRVDPVHFSAEGRIWRSPFRS